MKPLICPHCGNDVHMINEREVYRRPNGSIFPRQYMAQYFSGWEHAAENLPLIELSEFLNSISEIAKDIFLAGYYDARHPMRGLS
jgi:hypothetical protein